MPVTYKIGEESWTFGEDATSQEGMQKFLAQRGQEEGFQLVDEKTLSKEDLTISQAKGDRFTGQNYSTEDDEAEYKKVDTGSLDFDLDYKNKINPKGLRDQDYYDKQAGETVEGELDKSKVGAETVGGIAKSVLAFGSELFDDFKDAAWQNDENIALDSKDQDRIDKVEEYNRTALENLTPEEKAKYDKDPEAGKQMLMDKAKELYIRDGKASVIENNYEEYLESLSNGVLGESDEKERVETTALLATSLLDDRSKKNIGALELLDKTLKANQNEMIEIVEGKYTTEEDLSIAKKRLAELRTSQAENLKSFQHQSEKYEVNVNSQSELSEWADLADRNYNFIPNLTGKFTASALDMTAGLIDAVGAVSELPAKMLESALPAELAGIPKAMGAVGLIGFAGLNPTGRKEFTNWMRSGGDLLRSGLEKPQAFSGDNTLEEWGEWALDFTASQGPQIALMVGTGGTASLGIMGASAFGTKFDEMENNQFDEDGNFTGTKTDYTYAQMYLAASMSAGAEVLSEKVTLGQLKRVKLGLNAAKTAKGGFKKMLKDKVFNIKSLKRGLYDPLEEGGTEVLAGIADKLADKYILGKENVNILEGATESFVGGAFMSGALFKVPAIGQAMIKPFKTESLKSKFDYNAKQIGNLSNQLQAPNLDAKSKKMVQEKINELVNANNEISVNTATATDLLDSSQKQELIDIHNRAFKNDTFIDTINSNDNMTQAQKAEATRDVELENLELQKSKDAIMDPVIKKQYETTTQNVKDLAKNVEGLAPIVEIEDGVVSEITGKEMTGQEAVNEQIKISNDAKTKQALANPANKNKTAEQLIESGDLVIQADVKTDANNPGTIIQNTDGTQSIVINKTLALQQGQVNVAGHEFLHAVLNQTVKDNPAVQEQLGKSVQDYIGTLNPDTIKDTKFAARIKQYQNAAADPNSEITEADAFEETMTLLADAIATKDVVIKPGFLSKLGNNFSKIFKSADVNRTFNSGKDVVNFIQDFGKEVSSGKLSSSTLNIANKGAKGELTQGKKIKKTTKTKFSLPTVKGIQPKQVETMIGKVANRAVGKFFRGIPRNIREKAGLDRTTYIDSAKTELAGIAQKYDSTRTDKDGNQISFDSYMANTGMQRLNSLATRLGVESSEKGVTQSLDSPQAQQVADDSGPVETTVKELRKLIDPNSILPEGQATDNFIKETQEKLSKLSIDQLKALRYSTSQSLAPEAFAKIYDVPANKIFNKADNFKKGDAKNLQMAINKQGIKMQNLMPEGNAPVRDVTSKKGNKKVKRGGEGTKIPKSVQNVLYQQLKNADGKPKKVDSESGKQSIQYRKDPRVTNSEFKAAAGIVNNKVDPNYIPRSTETQFIKGVFEIMARNITNLAIRQEIDARNLNPSEAITAKAKVAEGKSKTMFSLNNENTTLGQAQRLIINKNTKFDYTSNIGEFIDTVVATNNVAEAFEKVYGQYNIPIKAKNALIESWKNINIQARLKEVEMDLGNPLKINQQKYLYESFAESQNQVIRDVLGISKDGLNYSDINQMEGMNNTLMDVVDSYRKDGKSEAEIYETMYTTASNFTGNSKVGNGTLSWKKQKNGDWKLVKNKNQKGDQRYDLYTNAGEMMKVLGLKKPKGFKPETKVGQKKDPYIRDLRKNNNNLSDEILNKSADYAKKNKDAFFGLLDWYKSLPAKQKAMHKNGMGMILASSYRGTKTLIRESAPVNSIAETDFNEGFGQYRYEHNPPASVMAIYSAEYLTDNKTKKQLQTEFDNFGVTIIPLTMDAVLDENYQSTIPLGGYGRFGRYYNPKNFGKFPFVTKLYNKKNNKWETKTYGDLAPVAFEIREAKQNKDNTIQKGKDALAKNPKLKQSLPNPEVLNKDINQMIEDTKGIAKDKKFSDIVAKRRGSTFKGVKLIASGAQDFQGLMYDLYAKGKLGEKQQKWVQDNLVKPYSKGIADIDTYRQTLKNDYASLLKKFPNVRKKLGKVVPGTDFTFDQALRVNLWTKSGFEIPGISKRDAKALNDIVNKDAELSLFNETAQLITKQDKWIEPGAFWDTESLISDLNNLTNKIGRKQFLADYIANTKIIFSKENLNKMEVALGTNWREAMEDSLYRMENGTNRPSGSNKLTNRFINWTNNSIGAIMFFNRKSALLQLISSVNFLNWSDNNPYNAAKAFGNFPQFIKDFTTLWNSDKLKQRRSGLKKDVNEAEIANAAKGSKNKAQAILSYLLKIGFTPTQLADSFAIASGGATFYRNRTNTYLKQGLSKADAEAKAFEDFSATSDVSQQSSDPMLISSQQASILGRLLLAFQNTPAQVTRIFNKASRDFINNRGDQKTNVSKMIYYGAVQATIFAALQQALFAMVPGFDDENDEEKKSRQGDIKKERIINTVVDTLLRGSGVYGAILATLKNTINTYFKEEAKDAFNVDHRNTLLEALNLSAPISSKLRKLNNAIKTKNYDKDVIDQRGWDVTSDGKVNLSPSYSVLGSVVEALTNLPMERMVIEINSMVEMLDSRNTTFQRIALALGYRTWDVNSKNEENDLIKIEVKATKKEERKQKVIDDRAERKRIEEEKRFEGKTDEEVAIIKRKDVIFKQSRSKQIKDLLDLGLTKKEIKALQYEEARVDKIIELQNKK